VDLWNANVRIHRLSIRTNFALIAMATTAAGLRRLLRLPAHARSVTQAMMDEYSALAAAPTMADRFRALDQWLIRYGHRGPHETDAAEPRFAELRRMLRHDLARPRPAATPSLGRSVGRFSLSRLLCLWEERREWFREQLMRRTQRLRMRILDASNKAVAAGFPEQATDVFFLVHDDLVADPASWRERVASSSVINARNAYHGLADGDTVEVNPVGGEVVRLESARDIR
jgi:hypothetical protein